MRSLESFAALDFTGLDFSKVEESLSAAVADGAFPGCAAAIGASARNVWLRGFGALGEGLPAPPGPRTLYDLASLTKVVATTSAAMTLAAAGSLEIAAPVNRYVPEFSGAGREAATIEHLLTHTSGLPAWQPLYKEWSGYRDIFAAILRAPLERPPGSREAYSDLGAILLGECVARAGGTPLATLSWKRVFDPLAMRETLFRPPASERWRIAPTEREPGPQGRPIHGEVHDENCRALGGVSGHAGLFSTASDLARYAGEVLSARRGEGALFPRSVAVEFTSRRNLVPGSTRALGWDTRSERGSSAGSRFSPHSFGHTGFTGTSIWIDPEREIFAILLSNRVHPTRANQKIASVRVHFHDTIIDCLEKVRRGRAWPTS